MKKSRFTEAQIVALLEEAAAGKPERCFFRQQEISDDGYYKWKLQYGGIESLEFKKVKELKTEKVWLKRLFEVMAPDVSRLPT